MDLEDEDVVLHHSPLDQYLEEVTDHHFEKYKPEPWSMQQEEKLQDFDEETSLETNFIFSMIDQYFYNGDVEAVDTLDAVRSCHLMLNSCSMSEEDQQLLIDLCEEINKVKVSKDIEQDKSSSLPNVTDTENFNKGLVFGIIVFCVSIILPMFTKSISWTLILTFLFFVLITISFFYYLQKRNKTQNNISNDILGHVECLVEILSSYDKVIDKTLRHIKEVEIITNGYSQINMLQTLLNQKVATSKGNQCLKLRSSLLGGLTELFNQLRVNVRVILGSKEQLRYDYKEEYVALMPIDAFSQILYSAAKTEDNVVEVTPLNQLKSVVCLYRVQLSEYIYIMVITLFAFHCNKNEETAKNVCFALEDTVQSLLKHYTILKEQYLISVRMVFSRKEEAIEKKAPVLPVMSEILHSSEVHLHGALARIQEMNTLFLENDVTSQKFPIAMLQALTNQFNLSLENAKFCIEDVVDKVLPKKTIRNFTNAEKADLLDNIDEKYVLFTPPVAIGDMLYEGESEIAACRESGMLNMDEIENALKESRESRKLMRELKTILSVKESPVGLVSFPLTKVEENPVLSDQEEVEFVCNAEKGELNIDQKIENKIQKSAYAYNPSDDEDDDEECGVVGGSSREGLSQMSLMGLPRISPMGLPIGLLSNLPLRSNVEEVTFGCSSSDEEEGVVQS